MSFSLQLQPQTVTVKNMTLEEHMAVRQTSFDRHLINFVFMQFHHSDYNHNRHFHPTCDKNLMIRAISTKECATHSVELLQHSVLKGNI